MCRLMFYIDVCCIIWTMLSNVFEFTLEAQNGGWQQCSYIFFFFARMVISNVNPFDCYLICEKLFKSNTLHNTAVVIVIVQ